MTDTQIVKSDPTPMIQLALEKGADLEKLEKILAIQERWEKNEGRKAYHAAMADFKKDPPRILKDKTVDFSAGGKPVKYAHADLATASEEINKALSNHGLSSSWNMEQHNGTITVICVITHAMGHSESTKLTASPDDSGSKNPIQAIGSTVAYLERYTLLALTGLAAHGDDTDAGGPVEYITEEQQKTITDLIAKAKDGDLNVFLKWAKADALDKLPNTQFNKVVAALKAKK